MQNILKRIFLLILFLSLLPCVFAQESPAQQAYNEGDYLQAAKLYKEQLNTTADPSAVLYYNLGNSYYKLGLTSKALACYYRAWRMDPRDEDIFHNLSFVLGQNAQSLIPTDVPASVFHLFFYLSIIELEGLLWLLGWLFVIVLIFALLSHSKKLKQVLILLGSIILLAGIWYGFRVSIDKKPLAVVNKFQAEVRSGPGASFPVNLSVPRNHIVEVKDTKDDWAQIYIPEEKAQGWVLKDSLEEI